MRNACLGLAILFLAALPACSPSDAARDASSGPCLLSDEDISAIRSLEGRHREQTVAGDFDGMAEDLGEDLLAWIPNQPEIAGKSQFREWQRAWEGGVFSTYEVPVDEIIGCGDIAFVKGSYTMAFIPEGSDEPISDSGRWIHLLRKTPEGRWLVIRDMFHSERPAPTG